MENKTPDEIEKEMMEHEQLHDDEINENINKESTRKIKTVAEIEQEIREKKQQNLPKNLMMLPRSINLK